MDKQQPQTPQMRIEGLIKLTSELADLFTRENEFLSHARGSDIASLQAEKTRLATAYGAAIREIATNRALVGDAGTSLLTALREATDRFNGLAQDQHALLEGVHKASCGLVQAIADEAHKSDSVSHPAAASYNGAGITPPAPTPVIVSINERA